MAALPCYKSGPPSQLSYRLCPDARPDGRKSFSWIDYPDFVQTAHHQLGGPIVLAGRFEHPPHRRNAPLHLNCRPAHPHLNPVECLWSVLRRTSQANRAFADPDHLITASQRGLHQLQYRHHAFGGCLTGTGLRKPP
ncbi:DDE endonuclease [Streptomyces sp. BK205]|uniref:DDE endonuclease n=1 Tax=Streptomyces sp. BK205 TaxID=2512164 RepID=UPI001FB2FCA5|nr:DDE endonuclease [Streptomyces sp. BK205]